MQLSWLPAHDGILARFGEYKVAEPLHTVHIVAMYIARREVREVFGDCGKGESRFLLAECVGQLNLVLELLCIEAPQLEGMIHAAAYNTIATHIKIYGEHLITMSLDAAKYGDAHVTLYVPQPYSVIFTPREQQLQLMRMELQFIDGLSVANVIPHSFVLLDVNDAYDATITSGG